MFKTSKRPKEFAVVFHTLGGKRTTLQALGASVPALVGCAGNRVAKALGRFTNVKHKKSNELAAALYALDITCSNSMISCTV